MWAACCGSKARALPRALNAGWSTRRAGSRARAHAGGLLRQQGARPTEFFARWVELKESRGEGA